MSPCDPPSDSALSFEYLVSLCSSQSARIAELVAKLNNTKEYCSYEKILALEAKEIKLVERVIELERLLKSNHIVAVLELKKAERFQLALRSIAGAAGLDGHAGFLGDMAAMALEQASDGATKDE